jgi:pyruvate/2-oxoglutarate dehydrogenase complex dihydrolipoamide dehydrogenase (E3) component
MPMSDADASLLTPDLCVIGAGSGGLSAAAGAVQLGASVVLVEGAEMGGDCLNYGCVPSKALIAAAHAAQVLRAGAPGVAGMPPLVDFAAVMAHVRAARATIAPHDSEARFTGLGVQVLRGWARFTGPDELQVGTTRIRARRVVLATGSCPRIPDLPGLAAVPWLTNETVFDLASLPAHLVILGGGPIGCEMAQAFRRLGSQVTLIQSRKILPRDDPAATALIRARLAAEGIRLIEDARVTSAGLGPQLILASGEAISGSHLLIATGRTPAVDRLNLPAAGIETSATGIVTDARLRTSNRRVFAIGDAAGMEQFTHVAGYHAGLVVRQALFGLPVRLRHDHIPHVTYTDPELAQVGLTEAEARAAHGPALTVVEAPFARNDRAITEAATEGFLKLMVVKGRPVGATLVGPGAGDQITPLSLAVGQGLKMSALAGLITAYPTRSDIIKAAVGAYYSPRLFANPWLKRAVALVQRFLP